MAIYYTPNQVPAYIAYRASPKIYRRRSPMLGKRRRRWTNIDLILFPEFKKKTSLSKKNNKKIQVEGRGGRGGFRDIPNYVQPQP